jgi:hypothetical protein
VITVSATRFRAELYKILEGVIRTGQPVEVALRGHKVRIVPSEPAGRLEALEPRAHYIVGPPDALVAPTFDAKAWERKARRRR